MALLQTEPNISEKVKQFLTKKLSESQEQN